MRVKIIDYYDVWGNDADGYEVMGVAVFGEYDVRKDFNGFNLLKKVGFLNKKATKRQVEVDYWDEHFVEFFDKKTGIPLCRIETIEKNYN